MRKSIVELLGPVVSRRLLLQIGSMVEQGYRRGFQHGVVSGVSGDDAYWFRYECRTVREQMSGLLRRATDAPWSDVGRPRVGTGMTAIDRLKMELPRRESHADLVDLLRGLDR